jgi:hypothetical protein
MKELLINSQLSKKLNPDYKKMAMDLLNTGMWDQGRLRFILECIGKNKPIYKTDMIYLESMTVELEHKIQKLQGSKVRTTKPKENTRALISDNDIDEILDRQNIKEMSTSIRKKGSFLARLFSEKF